MTSAPLVKKPDDRASQRGAKGEPRTKFLPYVDQDIPLEHLLEMTAGGSMSAFEDLYLRTRDVIYRTALRILHDQSEADEVMQDTFERLWRKAHQFDGEKGTGIAWILQITRNEALKRLKNRHVTTEIEGIDSLQSENPTAEATAILDSSLKRLSSCLTLLHDEVRDLIVMSYINGMTYECISQKTGLKVPTIKTKVRRGLIKLRTCFENER